MKNAKKDAEDSKVESHNHNRFAIISIISSGKSLGESITRQYTQVYAVFIGATPLLLSILTSLRNLVQLAFQAPFGKITDKFGRKPSLIIGLFISATLIFFYPTIQDPAIFLLCMVLYSISFSIIAPAWTGFLGDSSNRSTRASFIGKVTTIGSFVTMLGLLAVGWLTSFQIIDFGMQYSIIFRIGAISFLFAGLISIFLQETAPKAIKIANIKVTEFWLNGHSVPIHLSIYNKIIASFHPLIENRMFRRFVFISAFMNFTMSLGWPLFPYVREEYATPSEQSYLWAAFTLMQILSMTAGGKLADKFGRKKSMLAGRSVMFLIPGVLFLARDFTQIIWANIVGGLGFGIFLVASNAFIIDCASEETKGSYVGTYQLVMGIVTFIGSFFMGIVAEYLFRKIGQWTAIYILLLVVMIFRFIGGLSFIFVQEP